MYVFTQESLYVLKAAESEWRGAVCAFDAWSGTPLHARADWSFSRRRWERNVFPDRRGRSSSQMASYMVLERKCQQEAIGLQ